MNHSEVKNHLADYLEGDIDLGDRALVDAHLDDCADCAQEVSEMQQTIGLLRRLPEPEQPPMVAANVMRRIRAGETQPGIFERIGRVLGGIFEPTFVLPASAVAAAAFVVVVVQEPGGLSGLLENASGQGGGAIATDRAANPSATAAVPTPLSMAATGTSFAAGQNGAQNAGQSATQAQLSESRSYGAPAAQDFLAAPNAAARPRVYSDVGIDSGLRNARAEAFPAGATRTETRVRTRIQVDREGRPIATIVGRSQGSGTRALSPNPGFPIRGNGLTGGAVQAAGSVSGLKAQTGLKAQAAPTARGASVSDSSSGGEDVRDLWLERGLEDPVGFANFIAERNLAEQELWVARLSERASERGMLAGLLTALRASGDETAAWVADDFAAGQGR